MNTEKTFINGKKDKKGVNAIHGLSHTRIYNVWSSMKARCYNPNCPEYKYYGIRGIKVCDDWKNNFISFYNWAMANGYRDDLSIDRINNNGNYESTNCRWATRQEQCNNRRSNYIVEYKGEKHTITEIHNETKIDRRTIKSRIKKYGLCDKVFERNRNVPIEYNGVSHTIKEWSEIAGLDRRTIQKRIKKFGLCDKVFSKGRFL